MLFQQQRPMLWGANHSNEQKTMPMEWALLIAILSVIAIMYGLTKLPDQIEIEKPKKVTMVELVKIVKEKAKPEPPQKNQQKKEIEPKPKNTEHPKPQQKKVIQPPPPIAKVPSVEKVVESLPEPPIVESPIEPPVIERPTQPNIVEQEIEQPNEMASKEPKNIEVGLACPKQISPRIPKKASRKGISGSVTAEVHVRNGKVIDVTILRSTPPGLYDEVVIEAVMQYDCDSSIKDEVIAIQDFRFQF